MPDPAHRLPNRHPKTISPHEKNNPPSSHRNTFSRLRSRTSPPRADANFRAHSNGNSHASPHADARSTHPNFYPYPNPGRLKDRHFHVRKYRHARADRYIFFAHTPCASDGVRQVGRVCVCHNFFNGDIQGKRLSARSGAGYGTGREFDFRRVRPAVCAFQKPESRTRQQMDFHSHAFLRCRLLHP